MAMIREIGWVANRVAKYEMAMSREKEREGVGGRMCGKFRRRGNDQRDRVGGKSGGKVRDGDEQRKGERRGGWQNAWQNLEGVATIREEVGDRVGSRVGGKARRGGNEQRGSEK
jgi:hypothetical protein